MQQTPRASDVKSPRYRGSMARFQPELFIIAEIQIVDLPIDDRTGLVPAHVATPQDGFASRPVAREDPLLTVLILE